MECTTLIAVCFPLGSKVSHTIVSGVGVADENEIVKNQGGGRRRNGRGPWEDNAKQDSPGRTGGGPVSTCDKQLNPATLQDRDNLFYRGLHVHRQ